MDFYPIDIDLECKYKLQFGKDTVKVADYFYSDCSSFVYTQYNYNYFHIVVLF